MRYERKFILKNRSFCEIYSFIKCKNFKKIYSSRFVNSIYYDTKNLLHYTESLEGIPERNKVRIRFYNDFKNNMNLEYKIKSGDLGYKKFEEIKKYKKNFRIFKITNFLNSQNSFTFEAPESIDNIFYPSLFVSYKRDYFLSPCKNFRVTLDSKLMFSSLKNKSNLILKKTFLHEPINIIEIKYSVNSGDTELIEYLLSEKEIYLSRCSKYCIGIDLCY